MDVAVAQVLANPQHGAGGFTQFFIPVFDKLEIVETINLTNR